MLDRRLNRDLEFRVRIILARLEHTMGNLEEAFKLYAGMRGQASGKMGKAVELKMRLI